MAIDTPLITQQDFRRYTNVSGNLDPHWWQTDVAAMQQDIVRPLLGDAFMDELLTQTETAALTPENETFLAQYLRRAVCFYVLQRSLIHIQARVENKGVMMNNDDTSSPADIAGLQLQARADAELWMNAALKFLKANAADYPLYKIPCGCAAGQATTIPNLNTSRCRS